MTFSIPCVFLSAFIGTESQARAKLTIPSCHLAKPFTEDELHFVMCAALEEA